MNKFKIKKDRYTKSRGGSSQLLSISCGKCQAEILLYQKDGAGGLVRMYLDKIIAPSDLVEKVLSYKTKKDMHALKCDKCDELLAAPMVYEPENRLAYRIIIGAIHKSKKR